LKSRQKFRNVSFAGTSCLPTPRTVLRKCFDVSNYCLMYWVVHKVIFALGVSRLTLSKCYLYSSGMSCGSIQHCSGTPEVPPATGAIGECGACRVCSMSLQIQHNFQFDQVGKFEEINEFCHAGGQDGEEENSMRQDLHQQVVGNESWGP